MADKKISALTAATTPLAGTEVVPLVQSSTTKKVSVADLTKGRTVEAARLDSVVSGTNLVEITGKQIQFYNVGISNAVIKAADDSSSVNALEFNKTQVIVSTGNLVIGTAGKGIDFSADPSAAGMTSELLDDYEEGTWTPSLGGTATYTQRSGTYTKIGNIVYANCLIQVNLIGTGSSTTISGLPFTTVSRSLGSCPYFNTINTSVTFLTPFADGNSSTVKFLGATLATPNPTDGISVFRDGAYVILSVAYTV